MIIAAIRWLTIIMFCWNWIYWSMNHSAQVYLIAPTAVDGRDGGGVFCGGHWSTHRRMHACAVPVWVAVLTLLHTLLHLPSLQRRLLFCSSSMSVETVYMVNCGFFRFRYHLVLRFPGVSVFQTIDLPKSVFQRCWLAFWDPVLPLQTFLCSV